MLLLPDVDVHLPVLCTGRVHNPDHRSVYFLDDPFIVRPTAHLGRYVDDLVTHFELVGDGKDEDLSCWRVRHLDSFGSEPN